LLWNSGRELVKNSRQGLAAFSLRGCESIVQRPKKFFGSVLTETDVDRRLTTNFSAFPGIPRHSFNTVRKYSRSAFAAREYRPCFVKAIRLRSIPAAVFGPALNPL